MDLLIFIGSTSAFVYSVTGIILNDPDLYFFETSAMIITLVLVGNYIEQRTVKKTRTAIDELKKLQVSLANRIDPETGLTEQVNSHELKTDDIVLVNTGDNFPSDGIIIEGECFVDESLISGESELIHKSKGDEVIGSTIASSGNVKLQITRVGNDTILSNIIDLVKKAQHEKPEIQQLADRISGIFVPFVITISLLTFLIAYFIVDIGLTKSLLNSIAVLVISCPCAMGLATPTAIAAGVGRLSKNGVLVKSGRIMESFGKLERLIFDKTGTLTNGRFEIIDFESDKKHKKHYASLLYTLEQHSSHPIARSVISFLRLNFQPELIKNIEKVRELKGNGVEAFDSKNNRYFVGKKKNGEINDDYKRIALYINDEQVASIILKDQLRPGASESVTQLKASDIRLSILSGDTKDQVQRVADELQIGERYYEQSPQDKYSYIEASSKEEVTAMVGDGINDAAALSKANIGISMSDSTKIAVSAADIILMREDLLLLPKALRISKATHTTIKQNLFWAFSYNIIAIPLAAFGFLNPMWGALFMTFSDIMVIGNSIRLKYRKI